MEKKPQNVEEKYKKVSQHEHILMRPGMYLGNVAVVLEETFVMNPETLKVVPKMVSFSHAFLKMVDEVLTNALDHSCEDPTVSFIKVVCDIQTGEISITNNGMGVPIVVHKEHGIYVPELIFGHLLSGSNYDDTKSRTGAGINGIGVKLANIYSTHFTIETVDSTEGKKFIQTYQDNMTKVGKPKITKNSGKSYTTIKFLPDYTRFGMTSLNEDTATLLYRRTLDCIACTSKNVSVYFNGIKLKGKGLLDYVRYFTEQDTPIIFESHQDIIKGKEYIWEYAVVPHDHFSQVSFVNGNNTYEGGKHVDFILNQIVSKMKNFLETKKKLKDVKPSAIKDRLFLFLRATITNPQFNSQTKEYLTTSPKEFGCKLPVVSDKFVNQLSKTRIVDEIVEFCKIKEKSELSRKTDGKKTNKVFVPKLEDALWAGTGKSNTCTLILTEGLSAMTFAMWGRSVLGPQKIGVFPLKGKLLNVRDATTAQLLNNEELNNLKTIMGLKLNKKYTDTSELRYSKILCLTDADLDGSHIKALLVNVFHVNWPELLKITPHFLQTLKTPIVKVQKGKKILEFYTEQDYHNWIESTGQSSTTWQTRYFKGLGTSKKEDAQDAFKRFDELIVDYYHKDDGCDDAILLAFDKDNGKKSVDGIKSTDKRKEWLGNYDKSVYINSKTKKVPYQDLIHKELIHFSIYDNLRSIPNVCDGLKPSQRKILYYMLKNNVRKSMKVAQLSGYVSAETSYHHGEASLQQAIISMAQDFVGTNNINLLYPDGNMGSRLLGGKDAASPRYIFTRLADSTEHIFNKVDSKLLKYQYDDGMKVEPEWFIPTIPMVLVNGCEGIGTGYSTHVPCYNVKDIIENIKRLLAKKECKRMMPYFKGFKGQVVHTENGNYQTVGIWNKITDTKIEITELPVGTWISTYKEFLEKLQQQNSIIKDTRNETKDENTGIKFIVDFKTKGDLDKLIEKGMIQKELKLVKTFNINNMYLFDPNLKLVKYNTEIDILKEFFKVRIDMYKKKKDLMTHELETFISFTESKLRFIKEYIDNKVVLYRQTKVSIETCLETRGYPKMESSYDYLIKMPLLNLSEEKMVELKELSDSKTRELHHLNKQTIQMLYEADLISF